jgi:hypothetical protein
MFLISSALSFEYVLFISIKVFTSMNTVNTRIGRANIRIADCIEPTGAFTIIKMDGMAIIARHQNIFRAVDGLLSLSNLSCVLQAKVNTEPSKVVIRSKIAETINTNSTITEPGSWFRD